MSSLISNPNKQSSAPSGHPASQLTPVSHLDNRTFAEVVAGTLGPDNTPPPARPRKRQVIESEPDVIEVSDGSDYGKGAKASKSVNKATKRPPKRTKTKKAINTDQELVIVRSQDLNVDSSDLSLPESPTPAPKVKPRPRPRKRGANAIKPALTTSPLTAPGIVGVDPLPTVPDPTIPLGDPVSIPVPTTSASLLPSDPITAPSPHVVALDPVPAPLPTSVALIPTNLSSIMTSIPPLVPPAIGSLPTHDMEPCDVVAYPWFPNGHASDYYVSYSSIALQIPPEDAECIYKGIHFVQDGPHVNVATVPPQRLTRTGHAIYLRDRPTDLAVGLTFGSVTGCNLINAGIMPGSYPAPVRFITIFPLEELLPQTTALWGYLLDLNPITRPVIGGEGILFQTRRVPRNRAGTAGPSPSSGSPSSSTPGSASNSTSLVPASARSRFVRAGRISSSYPFVRPFEEPVPIYDGRASTGKPFAFTPEDFQGLTTRTRLTEDLPLDSIVGVGYTMGVWTLNSTELLSLNVQFVILLA
ncbi:hypothetical protein BDN72DRAFT_905973 [Pluteus cervinus]|uniref:Uncharacterized protein n=1 Tax=Pluteus cervinus TaxID=181527 RepID=A0ACD3A1Y3_9AGAR|nr:hypothetical protein BDN72DRAFT_905973 [Pluteus cervinus]